VNGSGSYGWAGSVGAGVLCVAAGVEAAGCGPAAFVTADDASAVTSSEDSTAQKPDGCAKKTTRKGHGRRPIPEHIEREIIVHQLTDEERICPCCGELRKEIGREISEQLEFIPSQLRALQHQRVRYACGACEENVILAGHSYRRYRSEDAGGRSVSELQVLDIRRR